MGYTQDGYTPDMFGTIRTVIQKFYFQAPFAVGYVSGEKLLTTGTFKMSYFDFLTLKSQIQTNYGNKIYTWRKTINNL